ncbi:immunity protein 70 of polymorphic toxin system [Raoultella sp. BIGb0149]|uniref:Imm70 family immunity protein n=1 Tax=Raoultella sp. BIGb0149 TaxID=2485116 RepID=UPI0010608BE8|nr:Imm70 family immunity protein [Raoultella sp. BIGb0149]TDQ23487.1 immunity protein 70 of polymorphic toxin system [Raoultella sp. BIGb0149]
MNRIGLLGAATIYGLGSPDDVELFFSTVSESLEQGLWGANYPVVMLKLYKKALNFDEIKTAKLEMDEIQSRLSRLPLDNAFYSMFGVDKDKTAWETQSTDLASFFGGFFKGFNTAYEMTLFLYDDFGEFVPMLLGQAEIPYAIEDSKRPVEEFDCLTDDDLPFWKR